jgi:hypothetical protein
MATAAILTPGERGDQIFPNYIGAKTAGSGIRQNIQ